LEVQSLRIALGNRLGNEESLKERYFMLEKLDETKRQDFLNMQVMQTRRKSYYGSKLIPKKLKPNDLVLLYDSRFQRFLGKFKVKWFGFDKVLNSYSNGSVEIQDFIGNKHETLYNGYCLNP